MRDARGAAGEAAGPADADVGELADVKMGIVFLWEGGFLLRFWFFWTLCVPEFFVRISCRARALGSFVAREL